MNTSARGMPHKKNGKVSLRDNVAKRQHTGGRFMLRREFWLNLNNPAEETLAEVIDVLKAQRLFAKTVRDGIRLICDLRRGSLDVLFELFPWVRAEFLNYVQALQPDTSAAEQRLEQQIARLEQLLLQQASAPHRGPRPAGPRHIEALGPLALSKVVGPVSDEDDAALVTVAKAKVDGAQIAQNFIRSMMALQQ